MGFLQLKITKIHYMGSRADLRWQKKEAIHLKIEQKLCNPKNRERKVKKNKQSLRDLPDNIKYSNTNVIGVPKGEERQRGTEQLFF